MRARQSQGPWLWPLVLVVVGIILLLNNFLLLGDFDPTLLWPLLLVLAGAQVLLQGDLLPGQHSQTFGITRGSVEAGLVEISAADIDVSVRALRREGRLIAGQYAAQSRPQMQVRDTEAHIKMDRAATPWFSLANWELGLARDLPWRLFISTHIGQVIMDLSDVIIQDVVIATGFGDLRFTCPYEALGTIQLRSALGNIQIVTPPGYQVQIYAREGRMFGVHADPERYQEIEAGVYLARDAAEDAPLVEVSLSGTFGDAYLA